MRNPVAFVCIGVQDLARIRLLNYAMQKTAAISVRVPGDMKAALEKAAAADRRTLASLVEKILADWLAGNAPAQTSPIAQEGIKIMKPIRFKKIAALSGSVADVPNPVAQPKKPGGKP